jgi:hypothetical protein
MRPQLGALKFSGVFKLDSLVLSQHARTYRSSAAFSGRAKNVTFCSAEYDEHMASTNQRRLTLWIKPKSGWLFHQQYVQGHARFCLTLGRNVQFFLNFATLIRISSDFSIFSLRNLVKSQLNVKDLIMHAVMGFINMQLAV